MASTHVKNVHSCNRRYPSSFNIQFSLTELENIFKSLTLDVGKDGECKLAQPF